MRMKERSTWLMISAVAVVISFLPSHFAFAVSENHFDETYKSLVLPFYEWGHTGQFKGQDDVTINYKSFENPVEKAAIVLLPGRRHSHAHYAELILDLFANGYSVYSMDHRGHGFSDRMTPNPQVCYVEDFDYYVEDLRTFVETIVKSKPHKKTVLVAHSMGAAVGTLTQMRYPGFFDKLVMTAPMFQLNVSEGIENLIYSVASYYVGRGYGMDYAPFQGDKAVQGSEVDQNLQLYWISEDTDVSGPRMTQKWAMESVYPQIAVGGVSNNWVVQAIDAEREIRGHFWNLAVPLLIFQGARDRVVNNQTIQTVCYRFANCQSVTFKAGQHNLFFETDAIRDPMLEQLEKFIDQE